MATYLYRCPEHGIIQVRRPMGSAPSQHDCPSCDRTATRVFTAPGLRSGSPVHRALLDRTAATADSPAVVAAPPSSRTPATRPAHPAHSRLPRP